MNEPAISFGPFRLLPSQRPVRLGSRAFDILATLVERAGEVVDKDELIARAWPTTVVEEGNLRLQVSALRRALGDGRAGRRYVVTVPGRGYNFVAAVGHRGGPRAPPSPPAAARPLHNLPLALTRMIGREGTVAALASRLSRKRVITIVGPGGIGKTTVALAVAEELLSRYEQGVWLIDLAPLAEPPLVASTVATVLGLQIHAEDLLPGLAAGLTDKRMLLILDNCEHLIDAAAGLAATLLRGAPGINILATSREPLGVDGEGEYRLRPLETPLPSSRLTAADALAFPAVQLFVDRVSTLIDEFVLTDADAPLVAEICRRLDGLPLAIEFAAARVEVLGIRGLAANLRDSLHLLWGRSRVAMPRHRTIRAVLDWSYGLLTEREKRFFRRLGIFAGTFTIEAASKVTMDVAPPPGGVVNQLADLVMKSLVTADIGGGELDFRLLETIRAYALEKLDESGEREAVARRHAEYYCDDFERAEAEWKTRPTADWLTDFRPKIDNLRGALDWTFSPKGDVSVGVALTVAAVPLWMQLSLLEECRGRVERALAALEAGPNRDARCEMKLHAALGASLLFTNATIPESGAALTRAREIAENLNDAEYLLQAFAGLFAFHLYNGQSRVALALAEVFSALAATRPNPTDRLTGERLLGVSQHLLGNQLTAQRHFERLLADPATLDRRSSIVRFQIDLEVLARVYLAWTLWLRGFPDQAIRAAGSSVEDARAADHALSHCFALARVACPIALLVGDLAAAEHYSEMLLDLSIRHALAHFCAIGRCQQGVLAIMRGDVATGLPLLRFGMNERARSPSLRAMTLPMAEALGRAGQIVDGLATIEAALAWTERSEDRWAIAELLRVKGELLLLQGAPSAAAAAEDYCRQALDWAGRQRALSWELRATTSLARLWRDQGHCADALALLGPVYGRFTEGFDTTDLVGAKRLLDELNDLRRN